MPLVWLSNLLLLLKKPVAKLKGHVVDKVLSSIFTAPLGLLSAAVRASLSWKLPALPLLTCVPIRFSCHLPPFFSSGGAPRLSIHPHAARVPRGARGETRWPAGDAGDFPLHHPLHPPSLLFPQRSLLGFPLFSSSARGKTRLSTGHAGGGSLRPPLSSSREGSSSWHQVHSRWLADPGPSDSSLSFLMPAHALFGPNAAAGSTVGHDPFV